MPSEGDAQLVDVFGVVVHQRAEGVFLPLLQAVEGQLDGATLRRMAADDRSGPERWLTRPFEAVHVRGPFVAVSVRRDPELGEGQGAQVLVFEWDGTRFRLDEVRHATRVDDAEDAGRYLRELLRLR